VLGMLSGAAISHNFALAGSPDGVGLNAQIAVGVCLVILILIGIGNSGLRSSFRGKVGNTRSLN